MSSTERTTTTAAAEGGATGAATEHTPMEGISSVETATTATATTATATATGKGKAVVQPTEEEDDSSDEEIPELEGPEDDDFAEIDTGNIVYGRRTRGKTIDWSTVHDDDAMDDEDDDDDDYHAPPEGDDIHMDTGK